MPFFLSNLCRTAYLHENHKYHHLIPVFFCYKQTKQCQFKIRRNKLKWLFSSFKCWWVFRFLMFKFKYIFIKFGTAKSINMYFPHES